MKIPQLYYPRKDCWILGDSDKVKRNMPGMPKNVYTF